MLRVLALVALAALLLAPGPADAHVAGVERAVFEAPELPAVAEATAPTQFFVADQSTDFAWPVVLIALLAAGALVRWRSRKLVAGILVLLVAVLGVEAALHSVHHALGGQPATCPTASIAGHLHGTTVVVLAVEGPVLRVGTVAAPSDPLLASLLSVDQPQPRAPPAALA